jgi:hypothetical protein
MQPLEESLVTKYVLHKHHLLEGSQADSILQVVNDIIALHATSAGTPYLSLFARMKNFQRKHLDKEFYVKRNLVRLQAMRGTLFITSTQLAPLLYQATKLPEAHLLKWVHKWGISLSEYHELAEKLYSILKGGEKTLPELKKTLPKETVRSVELKAGKERYKGTNVNIVLSAMMHKGIVISEKGPETLRITKANWFALLKEKYPNLNLESVGCEEAKAMLIKRYVEAFGPVTEDDIAWWTAFSKTEVKNALATMEKELLSLKIGGFEKDYLMLKTDYEQFVKFKPLNAHSVLLLPFEDPYTKGYKLRDRLVDSALEKKTYVGGGVLPTILLNSKIIGTWNRNIEEGKEPIKLSFFSHPKKHIEKEIIEKAKIIGRLMSDHEVDVEIEKTRSLEKAS